MLQTTRCSDADLVTRFGNGVARNLGIVIGAMCGVVVVESDTPGAEGWCASHQA